MARSRQEKLDFFVENTCKEKSLKLLDVGVADIEHSPFDNFLEKNYPYPENITALSIYPLNQFKRNYPSIKTIVYKGGRFPFGDNSFDVIHCNAVIEHVGGADRQVEFIKEIARVGRKFFITTPSRMFPVEIHTHVLFLHWLPKTLFDRLLGVLGKKWAGGDYMNLLSKNALQIIIKEAGVTNYRVITKRCVGLPLHYYVIGEKI